MNEVIRNCFKSLYSNEIKEIRDTIKNEEVWEFGYYGEEPNPHTENIKMLQEYLELLKEKLKEL